MFDSLKHWFQHLQTDSKLFDHPDDETIHVALASLLYHVISSDHEETHKEKHEFSEILKHEFELNDAQIVTLYTQAKTLKSDLANDLETIAHYLKHQPNIRMAFMNKINHLISLNGVTSEELEIFYDAQKVLFPEIQNNNEF